MTELSRSDLDRALEDALEFLPGEVFTPEHVISAMSHAKSISGYDFPADRVEPIIRRMVQRHGQRVGVRQGHNWWFSHGGKRLAVYARDGRTARKWTAADQLDLRREILRNGAPGDALSKIGDMLTGLRVAASKDQ